MLSMHERMIFVCSYLHAHTGHTLHFYSILYNTLLKHFSKNSGKYQFCFNDSPHIVHRIPSTYNPANPASLNDAKG